MEKNPQNIKALENNLNNLINCTISPDLKLSLKILFVLLSHPNREIRALSLGKIYFLLQHKNLQKIIVNELKLLSKDDEAAVSRSAIYSLDIITNQIPPFEIIDYLHHFLIRIDQKWHHKITDFLHSIFLKKIEIAESEIKNHTSWVNFYQELDYKFFQLMHFSLKLENKFMKVNETELMWEDYEKGIFPYNELNHLEYNPDKPIKHLSKIYITTFREKGHLRRLVGYLNDKDPNTNLIGIQALLEIVYLLLKNSNSKPVLKNNISLGEHHTATENYDTITTPG